MTDHLTGMPRRDLLASLGGLALGPSAARLLQAATALGAGSAALEAAASPCRNPGRPGDFDFLAGSWNIQHRQLKNPATRLWDEFKGEATCWSILGGVGSIEELRIPARAFSGLGLRLLDVQQRLWSDFWVNARSGVLTTPGTTGCFEQGVGTFLADESEDGRPIKVRGVWDRITPTSCRWRQGTSRDGGRTWEDNWIMDWARA